MIQQENQAPKYVSCGTVEEIPIVVPIREKDWRKKKNEVLRYCINILDDKQDGTIILLHDSNYSSSKDVETALKKITNRKIILGSNSTKLSSDVNSMNSEKNGQIIVALEKDLVGCEASNAIYLTFNDDSFTNAMMKKIRNLVCIQVLQGLNTLGNIYNLTRFAEIADIKGIKEDNTFYSL